MSASVASGHAGLAFARKRAMSSALAYQRSCCVWTAAASPVLAAVTRSPAIKM